MKTTKVTFLGLIAVFAFGMAAGPAAFGDDNVSSEAADANEERNIFGKIADGLSESTRTINEINRENMAAEKEAFRERHTQAVGTDPGFVQIKDVKGFGNKIRAVFANMKLSSELNSEKERARREEIQSHNSYRETLERGRQGKIAAGYKAIENGVVAGYKWLEDSVVSGYMAIEDKFSDAFLTQENDSPENAGVSPADQAEQLE